MGDVVTINFNIDVAAMHNALEEISESEEKARRYRIVYPNRNDGDSREAQVENTQWEYLEILYPTEQYEDIKASSATSQSGKAKLLLLMLYSKLPVAGFRSRGKGESEMAYLLAAMAQNSLLQNRYSLVPIFEPLDVKTFGLTHVLDQSFKLSLLAFHEHKCVPSIHFRNSNFFPSQPNLLRDAKRYTLVQLGFMGGFGYNPRPLRTRELRISNIKDRSPDVYAHIVATWELLLSPRYGMYNEENITVHDLKTYSSKQGWTGKRKGAYRGTYSAQGVLDRIFFQHNGVNSLGLAQLYEDESLVAGSEDRLDSHMLTSLVFLGYYDLWDCLSSTYRQENTSRSQPADERTTKSNRYLTPEEAEELFRAPGAPQRKWLLHTYPFPDFRPYPWDVPFDYNKKFAGEGARGVGP
jgi:hypothetical protein